MPLDLSNGIKGKQTHCQFSKLQWNATQDVFLALHIYVEVKRSIRKLWNEITIVWQS